MDLKRRSSSWGSTLFILLLIAGGGYFSYTKLKPSVPCAQPIHYRLGAFDSRFGISQDDFLKIVADAVAIWEKSNDMRLFIYDPNGPLVINLIYDNRQQATQQNQILESSANKTKESASQVQAQYQALKDSYAQQKVSYDSSLAAYDALQAKYSSEVSYYNSHGGAPGGEYERLGQEKNALDAQRASLEVARTQLNQTVASINTMIDTYNLLVDHVNATVSNINKTAGQEFKEGLYVQDASGTRIDIYEYSSKLKLLRVLAHELGHALGLGHTSNPASIMYELNQGNTEVLSKEDTAALKALCAASQ